jgi:hypothetical protein
LRAFPLLSPRLSFSESVICGREIHLDLGVTWKRIRQDCLLFEECLFLSPCLFVIEIATYLEFDEVMASSRCVYQVIVAVVPLRYSGDRPMGAEGCLVR